MGDNVNSNFNMSNFFSTCMHLVVHDTKEKLQVFLQLPDLLRTHATAQVAATSFIKQCYEAK